ncbi:MAG: hypothetical protein O2816_07155 [Planctomycetota bacterium]|nr:hypothetical protein [Planctomycetota bacterium]
MNRDNDRITFREDLDGLDDDETIVEDPEIRRAKTVLFLIVFGAISAFIVVLLVFFQPEGVVMTESWPNGYPRTRTTYVSAPTAEGRIPHGAHRAWHENGELSEEGVFEQGQREGTWRFWDEDGALDAARSGEYAADERLRGIGD